MKIRICLLLAAALAFSTFGSGWLAARTRPKAITQPAASSDAERLAHLEQLLDSLRLQLKIPAMSCAIVKDQKVVWAKGFGYADVENKIPATELHQYRRRECLGQRRQVIGGVLESRTERSNSMIRFRSTASYSKAKASSE